jgi:hypothetical protein
MSEEIEKYQRALGMLYDALIWYARPDFYHAVGFAFDSPCGGFDEDFSKDDLTESYGYRREMPGKMARAAIMEVVMKYGDLTMIGYGAEDGPKKEEALEGAGVEEDRGLGGDLSGDPAGG